MNETPDDCYRVKISGPGFAISNEARVEGEDDDAFCDTLFQNALSGAIAMASWHLCNPLAILAGAATTLWLAGGRIEAETELQRAEERFGKAACAFEQFRQKHRESQAAARRELE